MKKIFTLLIALVATATLWAADYDFKSGNLCYDITSYSEYTVRVTYEEWYSSNNYSTLTTLVIPEEVTYNGYTFRVTGIDDIAFYGCSKLTSVTIPSSITSIGGQAFSGCTGLTSVTIPSSVTSIDGSAFYGCTSVTETRYTGDIASWCNINFGGSIATPVYYSKNLYINNQEVKDLVIPSGVSAIKNYAFYGWSGLNSVTIPSSVTSIGKHAFYGCSGLTSVEVPNSVTSIGEMAFYGCSGLTSVEVPNSVTSIGDYAFRSCSVLRVIDIPDGVTNIANGVFYDCSGLTSVAIPSSVQSIGGSAFQGCSSLLSVVIPDGVTEIEDLTFYHCSKLASVTIPNSVQSIGKSAFYGCSKLTSIAIPNSVKSIGNSAFLASGLTSVVIPEGVTNIEYSTFYNCRSLTSVVIPSSVTTIGSNAFSGCSSMASITCEAANPPALTSGDISIVPTSIPVYVPCGTVEAYKAASGWSSFTNIQEPQVKYSVEALVQDPQMGSAEVTSYTYCDGATLNATRYAGYHFTQWSDGNTDNPRTVEVTADATYTAEFAVNTYNVTVGGEKAGTVPTNEALWEDFKAYFNEYYSLSRFDQVINDVAIFWPGGIDSDAKIMTSEDSKYKWLGDYIQAISAAQDFVIASEDKWRHSLWAFLNKTQRTSWPTSADFTEAGKPEAWSDAYAEAQGWVGVVSGNGIYPYQATATLTVTPNTGYHFVQWSDGNTDNPRTVEVTADATYAAEFAVNTYNVTVGGEKVGTVPTNEALWEDFKVYFNEYYNLSCADRPIDYVMSFWNPDVDADAKIMTSEDSKYKWLGDYIQTVSAAQDFVIDSEVMWRYSLQAFLNKIQRTAWPITADFTEAGKPEAWGGAYAEAQGWVGVVSGNGIYPYQATATLTVTPNTGYHFVQWSDGNTDNPRTVEVTADATYTAEFAPNDYEISVSVGSTGLTGVTPTNEALWEEFKVYFNKYYSLSRADQVINDVVNFWNSDVDPEAKILTNDNSKYKWLGDYIQAVSTAQDFVIDSESKWRHSLWAFLNKTQRTSWPATADFTEAGKPEAWSDAYLSAMDLGGVVTGGGTYKYGETATLTANANYGFHFVQWSDGNTDSVRTVEVTADAEYSAEFERNEYVLEVTASENGTVEGAGTYTYGATVTLTATPDYGYHFIQWSDGNTSNTRTVKVKMDITYTAEFAPNDYEISVSVGSTGLTGVTPTNEALWEEFKVYFNKYYSLSRVDQVINDVAIFWPGGIDPDAKIMTSEDSKYKWLGDYIQAVSAAQDFVIDSEDKWRHSLWAFLNKTRRTSWPTSADFTEAGKPEAWSDAYLSAMDLGGVVTGGGTYKYGETATLTANANYGFHFVQWSDGNTDSVRTVEVTADAEYSAEFERNEYVLEVVANGNGAVTGAGTYKYMESVTLTATPDYGYHFVQWSDGVTTNTRTVKVDMDMTYTAEFAPNEYTVQVFAHNDSAALALTNENMWEEFKTYFNEYYSLSRADQPIDNVMTFWNSGVDADAKIMTSEDSKYKWLGDYILVVSTAQDFEIENEIMWRASLQAFLNKIQRTTSWPKTADFTEAGKPEAWSAAYLKAHEVEGVATGTGTYTYGSTITLKAASDYGYHFAQWSDGNIDSVRTVEVTADAEYVAEFERNEYVLEVMANGNGAVTGAGTYKYMESVTLTATPDYGYHFVQWSDSVTTNTRTVKVDMDMTYTAEFAPNEYNVQVFARNDSAALALANENMWEEFKVYFNEYYNLSRADQPIDYVMSFWNPDVDADAKIMTSEDSKYKWLGDYILVVSTAQDFEIENEIMWRYSLQAFLNKIQRTAWPITADFTEAGKPEAWSEAYLKAHEVEGVATGTGTYTYGSTITLKATSDYGYHFAQWSDGNIDSIRTVEVTADAEYVAEFERNEYVLEVVANGNGAVTGAGTYKYMESVTLTATPDYGYHFVQWSDGDKNAERVITVTESVALTAEFAINVYEVTIAAGENGVVSGAEADSYEHGTELTITATANEGYHFVQWSDGDKNAERTITVTESVALTAEFAINVYEVTIAAGENGKVSGDKNGTYNHGTVISLTADPNKGYHFVKWSDGNEEAARTITVTEAINLTAEFAINVYEVVLKVEGQGSVAGADQYEHNDFASISATPAEGYHFVQWSDGNTDAKRTIKVTNDTTLTAIFEINTYEVTIVAGENGTVSGAASGMYNYGTELTLIATPAEGYRFVQWNDGNTEAERTITVTGTLHLTAEFASNMCDVVLHVEGEGDVLGAGKYELGERISISAIPAEGYHFVMWSDGDTNATRKFNAVASIELTAIFEINTYEVTIAAGENGTVSGAEAGTYNHGTELTITATPDEGYRFLMWSDGNADAERTITVTEDITLTAEFVHDTATELDNVQNGNTTIQKVYQDGTLFIIREGKKYNANGQLVK